MNESTYRDSEVLMDVREATIGDWRGFAVNVLFMGGLVFVSLHVGVKLGYALAYFEIQGYPPSELVGRSNLVSDTLLVIGVTAILTVGAIEVFGLRNE